MSISIPLSWLIVFSVIGAFTFAKWVAQALWEFWILYRWK